MVSRRAFLSGAAAGLANAAFASPPEVSLRPLVRPREITIRSLPGVDDLLREAALGGRVAYSVADASSGEVLESRLPLVSMPPASVAKAITTAYGLDRLGPDYRFRTRLMADGAISGERLEGDLWLVGGGDPVLDTDNLSDMAAALAAMGIREVTGRLMLATDALPYVRAIDPQQPPQSSYNPAISGLNLNFNRVHFEWSRAQGGYAVSLGAPSQRLRPEIAMARMRVADRVFPIYTYVESAEREEWTVARGALGNGGSRWLPVRRPHLYAGEVFQILAQSHGLALDGPEAAAAPPAGARVLVEHASPPLEDVLREMMRWSTNLTAEAVGLMASKAGGTDPGGLAASGAEMGRWMTSEFEARRPHFVDHSGLGDESRITANDMTRALVRAGADGVLRRLMKEIPIRDDDGRPVADHPVQVVAKTGTLHFVSCLSGYVRADTGRDLAFTVFCADLDRRSQVDLASSERPDGARSYNTRAKDLQQGLIERWATAFA